MSHFNETCNWCGKANYRNNENNCSEKCDRESKAAKIAKREERDEKEKAYMAQKKIDAGIRSQKAEYYRTEGKPLIAFIAKLSPSVKLGIGVVMFFFIYLSGQKYGVLGAGVVITLFIFLFGFVLKDLLGLERKAGLRLMLILVCSSIGGTIGTYFYKSAKAASPVIIESAPLDSQALPSPITVNEEDKIVVADNEVETEASSTVSDDTEIGNAVGSWNGAFGKDHLTITIESVDESGNVMGFDELKGNRRPLKGNKSGDVFTLNEPGDDSWDGVFTFKYGQDLNTIVGEWKANNGKSTKPFTLYRN